MGLDYISGLITSGSSFNFYSCEHPEALTSLDELIQDMKAFLLDDDTTQHHEVTLTTEMPYFMLMTVKSK